MALLRNYFSITEGIQSRPALILDFFVKLIFSVQTSWLILGA